MLYGETGDDGCAQDRHTMNSKHLAGNHRQFNDLDLRWPRDFGTHRYRESYRATVKDA